MKARLGKAAGHSPALDRGALRDALKALGSLLPRTVAFVKPSRCLNCRARRPALLQML